MITIKMIKQQLKMIQAERVSVLHTTKDFGRLLELKNVELYLSNELIKILEIQLNKKNNVKKGA